MRFDIRNATWDDVQAMNLLRNAVRENRLSDPASVTSASYRPYMEKGSLWVAETAGRIVGFAAVDPNKEMVWALFVEPESEGSGIGRALHCHLVKWAAGQGLRRLSLRTESNSRAASFYRRAGWIEIGVSPEGETIFETWLQG